MMLTKFDTQALYTDYHSLCVNNLMGLKLQEDFCTQ